MRSKLFVCVASVLVAGPATAALVTNGDFETGDLTGWTLFTLPNSAIGRAAYGGDLGNVTFPRPPKVATPGVTPFDTDDDGTATNSAVFDVGLTASPSDGGGGIYQNIITTAGLLEVSLDIATWAPLFSNGYGGLFRVLVDSAEVARHDFGEIDTGFPDNKTGAIERAALSGSIAVGAGAHEIRIEVTRGATNSIDSPQEYLDNVVVIPEPATLSLLGLGGLSLLLRRRR